jgi:hypothetical protein
MISASIEAVFITLAEAIVQTLKNNIKYDNYSPLIHLPIKTCLVTWKARKKRQYKAKSCHFDRAGLRICKQPVCMHIPNYPIRNHDLLYEFTMKYTSKSCHLKMAALKYELHVNQYFARK